MLFGRPISTQESAMRKEQVEPKTKGVAVKLLAKDRAGYRLHTARDDHRSSRRHRHGIRTASEPAGG